MSADFRIVGWPSGGIETTIDDLLAKVTASRFLIDPLNQTCLISDAAGRHWSFRTVTPRTAIARVMGTDNVAAGRQAGELIKEIPPTGGKIMLLSESLMPGMPRSASRVKEVLMERRSRSSIRGRVILTPFS
jgi:ribose transport system substrate-binding protein